MALWWEVLEIFFVDENVDKCISLVILMAVKFIILTKTL